MPLQVDTIERMKDGHLIHHYLLASYCYYQLSMSPMTDAAFDRLCKRLQERWDFIDGSVFPHKHLIDLESLEAGTCMLAESKYPTMVKCSAYSYDAKCHTQQFLLDLEPHLLPIPSSRRIARRTPPTVATVSVKPARIVRTPPKG